MSNISDKDLDKLFREAAEGYQASFDESAWEDMERKIDDGGDDGFSYFKILGGIIAILMLSSVAIWWISSENHLALTGAEDSHATAQAAGNIETSGTGMENALGVKKENTVDGAEDAENSHQDHFLNENESKQNVSGNYDRAQRLSGVNSDDHEEVSGRSGAISENENSLDPSGVAKVNTNAKLEEYAKQSGNSTLITVDTSSSEKLAAKRENDLERANYGDPDSFDRKHIRKSEHKDEEKSSTNMYVKADDKEMVPDRQNDGEDLVEGEPADQAPDNVEAARLTRDKVDKPLTFEDEAVRLAENNRSAGDRNGKRLMPALEESADNSSQKNNQVWVYSPAFLERMDYPEYQYPYPEEYRKLNGVEIPDPVSARRDEQASQRGFAVEMAYSPDLTSVGYFKPDRPGSNFGLMGSYFMNRWSVSTGAIYSRKIYFSEESSGGGYYSGPSDFTRIDGDCRVIDIPINISYYLSNNVHHGFYLSAGFSSYIMLRENYDFLTKSNGTEREWSSEYENKNNHFFSVLNLSLGYERRIKNGFFIQLEPFVKAPVSGIGEGKVDLVSTGAFLNLMYKFNHKNK
ncbi:PorT family protein [Fulvivirga ulvae]|uniref:PorT family protein n=1 Tax=Fulvivirga ulvae TaxID=2904245 RepID=UPI001F274AF4|nr:PorT family protein [Fulvivirga ulvae]UII30848.1 PorT family protein [Fulvivirga ulvae]